MKFTGITVCIWDFDGTLYHPNPALTREIIEADYEVVRNHTGWTREKTIEEFHKVYRVKTPSSTESASILAGISIRDAAVECERYKDRLKYLTRDDKLVKLFQDLATYTHYMLVNGIQERILSALARLGVPKETFTEIVTSEIVGVTKPNPEGFKYILRKTGMPASEHLMIGDREAVDLVPAKARGMHTCLVSWDGKKGQTDCVDSVVPDVYTVGHLLL